MASKRHSFILLIFIINVNYKKKTKYINFNEHVFAWKKSNLFLPWWNPKLLTVTYNLL